MAILLSFRTDGEWAYGLERYGNGGITINFQKYVGRNFNFSFGENSKVEILFQRILERFQFCKNSELPTLTYITLRSSSRASFKSCIRRRSRALIFSRTVLPCRFLVLPVPASCRKLSVGDLEMVTRGLIAILSAGQKMGKKVVQAHSRTT